MCNPHGTCKSPMVCRLVLCPYTMDISREDPMLTLSADRMSGHLTLVYLLLPSYLHCPGHNAMQSDAFLRMC